MEARRRGVGIVLGLIVAGLVAGALYIQGVGRERELAEPGLSGETSAQVAPGAELATAHAIDASADLHAAGLREAATSKRSPVASEDEFQDDPTCLVRVVRSTDESPFAGIEVNVMDSASITAAEQDEMMAQAGGIRGVIRLHSVRYTTNAIGEVGVAIPVGNGLLSAGNSEWFGMLEFKGIGDATVTLEVSPDPQVRIFVKRTNGEPAPALPVFLGRRSAKYKGTAQTFVTYQTDTDGLAVIDGLTAMYEQTRDAELVLSAGVLGAPELSIVLPRDVGSMAEVHWVLPPTAAVRLRIVDSSGEALHGSQVVLYDPDHAMRTTSGLERNGVTEFAYLPTGKNVAARVHAAGYEPNVFMLGPFTAGDLFEQDVVLTRDNSTLRLLLTIDGEPLRNAVVGFKTQHASGSVRTDADGRASIQPAASEAARSPEISVFHARHASQPAYSVAFNPARHRMTKEHEHLLDLAIPPVLAAGRVLDPNGDPVSAASVEFKSATPSSESMSSGPARRTLTTTKDGSFQFHGEHMHEVFSIHGSHSEFGTAQADAVDGQTDVTLQLPGSGSLRGQLVSRFSHQLGWTEALQRSWLQISVHDSEVNRRATHLADWSFDVANLNAGLARVTLAINYNEEFLSIENVLIEHGEVTEDSRLQINLDALLHFTELEIVDPFGIAIETCTVNVTEHSADSFVRSWVVSGGTGRIITREAPIQVRIGSPLFLDATVDNPAESERVTLTPRPTVKLHLAGGAPNLPGGGAQLFVSIEGAKPFSPFNERGVATLHPNGPGEYDITLQLMDSYGMATNLHQPDWEAVRISAETTELEIMRALEPGWLDEELAKLAAQKR